jgi:hypothetical protein
MGLIRLLLPSSPAARHPRSSWELFRFRGKHHHCNSGKAGLIGEQKCLRRTSAFVLALSALCKAEKWALFWPKGVRIVRYYAQERSARNFPGRDDDDDATSVATWKAG